MAVLCSAEIVEEGQANPCAMQVGITFRVSQHLKFSTRHPISITLVAADIQVKHRLAQ